MPRLQRLRAFLSLVTGSYALAVLIFLVLRLLTADSLGWVALLTNFTPFYFLPFAVLLPLALLIRARRAALLVLPLTLVGALLFGRLYLPKTQSPTSAPPDAPTLRLVSFNVWSGNSTLAQAEDWLREMQADVVAIIELPPAWADGIPALTDAYPDQFISSDTPGGSWDSAILSRHPIRSSELIDLGDGDIPQQRVVIDVGGQQVAIYGIHLYVPSSGIQLAFYDETARNRQIRSLLRRLQEEPLPYVVMGDFNMSDQSLIYTELAAAMQDSYREAGTGLGTSWPLLESRTGVAGMIPPLVRIDYIWHSAHFRTLNAALGPYLGSDHLPVYATLALHA